MAPTGIEGKVVLLTGGTKGIGRAAAIAFRKEGAKLALNYGSDKSTADKIVKELGGEDYVIAIQADSGSVAGAEKMVNETVKKFGKIDILIPNAGMMKFADIENITEEDFDKHFNLNVKGPWFLINKSVPHMAPGSRIILVSSSLAGNTAVLPGYGLYCATKGSIEQMTKVLSKDLLRKSITVNAVAPGPTGTDLFYQGKSEELLKVIAAQSPLNRIGLPEEVADAYVFFASDQASWVSGQLLRANGGSV